MMLSQMPLKSGESPSTDERSASGTPTTLVECPRGPLVVAERAAAASAFAPRLSVVVPTFNERKNVPELVARLAETLGAVLGRRYEIIVVDDDSPDRTWELASELGAKYPALRVVRRQGERGLSTAVIRGWQVASGDALGVIDGDLQHPPDASAKLWAAIEQGADLAVGSRNVHGGGVSDWSAARRMLSRGAQACGLLILPGVLGRLRDPMSGYFVVRRSAISGVQLDPLGYKILVEVVGRGRIKSIEEVGYVFRERVEGNSKVSWRIYLEYLRHLVRLRRARR
jgi:dolichol-phosphate mannosyltransferase